MVTELIIAKSFQMHKYLFTSVFTRHPSKSNAAILLESCRPSSCKVSEHRTCGTCKQPRANAFVCMFLLNF